MEGRLSAFGGAGTVMGSISSLPNVSKCWKNDPYIGVKLIGVFIILWIISIVAFALLWGPASAIVVDDIVDDTILDKGRKRVGDVRPGTVSWVGIILLAFITAVSMFSCFLGVTIVLSGLLL